MDHNTVVTFLSVLALTACLSTRQKGMDSLFQTGSRDSTVSDKEFQAVQNEIKDIEGLKLTSEVQSGDNKGYWSTGLMVGRYGEFEYRGNFFGFEHLQFDLGALINQPDKLFYTPYRIWVALYKKSVKENVLGMNPHKPVVIRYVRQNPLNPFQLSSSPYFAYAIDNLNQSFDQPDHFEDPENTSRGSAGEGFRYGRVVRVDRWGLFGKTCTLYLHEGKVKSDGSANINPMNIYSEEGCRYVEKLAKSGTHARFDVSFQFIEVLNGNRAIVHEIWANQGLPPLNTSPNTTESP